MESSWLKAYEFVNRCYPHCVQEFGFDLLNDDLNYICNGMNRNTFHQSQLWVSRDVKWRRVGLGVFDFLRKNTRVPLPDTDDTIDLQRTVGFDCITMRCIVQEIHLQQKEELGELMAMDGDKPAISSVCGRAVLLLLDLWVK